MKGGIMPDYSYENGVKDQDWGCAMKVPSRYEQPETTVPTTVGNCLEELERNVAELREVMSQLHSRIAPVLNPGAPPICTGRDTDKITGDRLRGSDVARKIQGVSAKAWELVTYGRDIIEAVDL